MKNLIIAFFILFIQLNILSQWTADSSLNTAICTAAGEQVTPKISPTTDGGWYVAWFDNRSSGYAVYLQRLTQSGVKMFTANGLLISSNPQSSSLVDWDMITDDANNAIIVFTDTRASSSINPYIYKISPTGTFLWGANGIALTDSPDVYQANPRVAKTSDGNYVAAWIWGSTPQKTAMMKLSSTGIKLWNGGVPVKLAGTGTENFTYPSLVTSDNGAVILLWSGYSGSFINPQNYRLYTSKLSPSGAPLWSNPQDTVYNLGAVAGFFVPKLIPDGNNGAIYVWQDSRDGVIKSAVQRMNSAGVKQFPINGTQVSTQGGRLHLDAWACITPAQETFLFWKEANSTQTQFGFYGQKLSSAGVRQWTDNGLEILPLSNSYSFINNMCFRYDTSAVVIYNQTGSGNTNFIRAFRIGKSGAMIWGPKSMSGFSSSKSKIVAGINGAIVVDTWSDGRNDAGDIYAQNIWVFGGELGMPEGISENKNNVPNQFKLYQNYPNPFNPKTILRFALSEVRGQMAEVRLVIYNSLGQEVKSAVSGLVNDKLNAGTYEVEFDGTNCASGVYYYSLIVDDNVADTKRMILIK